MSDEQRERSQSIADLARDWYHIPVLSAIVLVMLWMRLRSYGEFVRDGTVYFAGNDAWYHLRQVNYTVRNWPMTMPFDPWTEFPIGRTAGQFGTIYDQIVATVALIIGLGSPSADLVAKTLLVAPAVFGAFVAIPTYFIGKRLGGRLGGLFGAFILMLLPGTFLQRGLVGFADHNIAEPFFQGFAVLAIMIAVTVADREKPVWELVQVRDFDALREPLKWSVLAGVATAIYMWAWPPGILLVGVFGLFVVLKMTADYVRGYSPEHVAFVAAVSMTVTAVLMIIPFNEPTFGVTDFGFLQPTLSLVVGLGAVFLAGLARWWESNDVDDRGYPVAVAGLAVVGIGLFSVILPDVFSSVARNFLRTVGFSAGAATRTIGEAQPFIAANILQASGMTAVDRIMSEYGFTFFTAAVGIIWLVAKPLVGSQDVRKLGYVAGSLAAIGIIFLIPAIPAGIGALVGLDSSLVSLALVTALIVGAVMQADYESEQLFVLVWAAIMTSAAFTQVRFNYYLAVVVAVMNAYLLREVLSLKIIGFANIERFEDVSAAQVGAVAFAILLVLTPVLIVPVQLGSAGQSNTAWETAGRTGPGSVTQWNGSLQWMEHNTPKEGAMGGASNDLEYYGTYEYTNDFDYPDGSYGVMSWWDYGHWITVLGERIPNANPFQGGATEAANFLLASNEDQAEEVLTTLDDSGEGENTRYVMVDWQMVSTSSKFGAPTVWYDESNVSTSDFYNQVYRIDEQQGQERITGVSNVKDQRYYESLMVRLYKYHGSARAPSPVVVDWDVRQLSNGGTIRETPADGQPIKTFDSMEEAEAYVANDSSSQIGGIGSFPEERVEALDHYRLVKSSNSSALRSGSFQNSLIQASNTFGVQPQALLGNNPSWVKTFERVPGSTIEGSGAPANTTVTATVEMRDLTTNTTFAYTQQVQTDENGEFSMVVPYSTTGYDDYGPENGYTNVSVRATGGYTFNTPTTVTENSTFVTYQASNVSVDEGLVNGAEDGTVEVTLERTEQELTVTENNSSSTNETSSIDASALAATA